MQNPLEYKEHLGDGVYADFDGYQIVLKANDYYSPTDTIALEPSVMKALKNYEKHLNELISAWHERKEKEE